MNLDDIRIRDLAGERAFERGADYARRGRVRLQENAESRLRASVKGRGTYRVLLDERDAELVWECDCPAADNGDFCKHLVAAAIVARAPGSAESAAAEHAADLRAFLRAQPAERLADWLAELAADDPAIEKRLRLRRSQSDPHALKNEIVAQLRGRGFLDWRASTHFAHNLDALIDSLEEACDTMPEHGAELCELALTRLFKRYRNSDDSSGTIGTQLWRIADRYRRTLAQFDAADGAALGRRFLDTQRHDEWNVLRTAEFWPVLGPAAQDAYAAAVEAEYAKLGPAPDIAKNAERWSRELPVVQRMEQLAAVRGDVDGLIRVISRDLSSGDAYERIVEICRDAGRDREATFWAERGYREHPTWRGMRALLAERYRHDGLDDRALDLTWEDFCAEPSVGRWQRLKTAADERWPEYRQRALERLERAEKTVADGRRDVTARAQLLLADGDADHARQLVEQHAVNVHVLEPLAAAVASSHPASAARFICRAVDVALPTIGPTQYGEIANLVATARSLARDAEIEAWIAALRERYRARRKLMALLDAALATTGSS